MCMTLGECGRILEAQPACPACHTLHALYNSRDSRDYHKPCQIFYLGPSSRVQLHNSNYTQHTTSQDRHDEVDIQYVLAGLRLVGAPPLTLAPEDLKQQKFVVEAEPSETVSSPTAHNDMFNH